MLKLNFVLRCQIKSILKFYRKNSFQLVYFFGQSTPKSGPLFKNRLLNKNPLNIQSQINNSKNLNSHSPKSSFKQDIKISSFNSQQSLITNILRCRSIEEFYSVYKLNKGYYSPYIYSVGSRTLVKLLDNNKGKWKNNIIQSNKSFQSIQLINQYLLEMFLNCKISKMPEEITQIELRNWLYLLKKIKFDYNDLFCSDEIASSKKDDQFEIQMNNFKSQIIQSYINNRINLKQYEINGIIEIFYHIMKLEPSIKLQKEKDFYEILMKKYEEQNTRQNSITINYFYSTGTFFIIMRQLQRSNLSRLSQIKQQCYLLILTQWIRYYKTQFRDFIYLKQFTKIWYAIVCSNLGYKILKDHNEIANTLTEIYVDLLEKQHIPLEKGIEPLMSHKNKLPFLLRLYTLMSFENQKQQLLKMPIETALLSNKSALNREISGIQLSHSHPSIIRLRQLLS